tara:strand:+ start:114 stop:509 length:396 start_codon:yes stop_codon:yes gene_type:complete
MEGAQNNVRGVECSGNILLEIRASLARIERRLDTGFRMIQKQLGDTGSFYEQHEGIKYKHALLEQAREALGSGGRISENEVNQLWATVSADGKISDLERRTLQYIRNSDDYRLTDRAIRRLDAYLTEKVEC